MRKTILETGFEPFGEIKLNPSHVLVDEIGRRAFPLRDIDLSTEILPVVYETQ